MGKSRNKYNEKVINTFQNFLRKEVFQKNIKELRKKYNVPPAGIAIRDEELKKISQRSLPLSSREFNKDMESILSEFPLKHWGVLFLAKIYFFYNDIDRFVNLNPDIHYGVLETFNLANDLATYEQGFDPDNGDDPIVMLKEIVARGEEYPVAIGIHKDASKRDLLDFIAKSWKEIIKQRASGGSKLLEVRGRKSKNRFTADLIYKNKGLSIKEIRGILSDQNIFKDDGEIAKIRSQEIKRRN